MLVIHTDGCVGPRTGRIVVSITIPAGTIGRSGLSSQPSSVASRRRPEMAGYGSGRGRLSGSRVTTRGRFRVRVRGPEAGRCGGPAGGGFRPRLVLEEDSGLGHFCRG